MSVITPSRSRGDGVILVGYRASGKTTVGRLLAQRLNRTFLDTDAAIEAHLGCSIAELFAKGAESSFRSAEQCVLRILCEENPKAVVATGGGAILSSENRDVIRQFGTVVWLTAPSPVLIDRLQHDAAARPALTAAGLIHEVPAVLAQREPLYQEVADIAIDVAAASPDQAVESILRHFTHANVECLG